MWPARSETFPGPIAFAVAVPGGGPGAHRSGRDLPSRSTQRVFRDRPDGTPVPHSGHRARRTLVPGPLTHSYAGCATAEFAGAPTSPLGEVCIGWTCRGEEKDGNAFDRHGNDANGNENETNDRRNYADGPTDNNGFPTDCTAIPIVAPGIT